MAIHTGYLHRALQQCDLCAARLPDVALIAERLKRALATTKMRVGNVRVVMSGNTITRGTTLVFADLGFPDVAERQTNPPALL